MTFITRVERPQQHVCDLPEVGNLDYGTVWRCDCGLEWGIKLCFGTERMYRAWRGMVGGKFRPLWDPNRRPPARHELFAA